MKHSTHRFFIKKEEATKQIADRLKNIKSDQKVREKEEERWRKKDREKRSVAERPPLSEEGCGLGFFGNSGSVQKNVYRT